MPSVNTRELLVEEGGFLYDSDASNDELPYFADVKGTRFLVLPYSKVYNDVRYLLAPTYSTPDDFFESLRLGVEYMLGEAERGSRWPHDDRRAALALERPGIIAPRRSATSSSTWRAATASASCAASTSPSYWLEHYGDLPVMG